MTWDPDWGLRDRGVIVTGAAGGIGSAVAEAFAALGARVFAVDLDRARVEEVVRGLPGGGHAGVAQDLTELDALDGLMATAVDRLGDLWALAHVAGVLRRRPSVDAISVEDWDAQLDANLRAPFFLCRAAARTMVARGKGGRIITFASNAAWTGGLEGSVAYAASKGGIVSLTRGLARSYGHHGITVNTVAPGEVDTPMLHTGLDPAKVEEMRLQIPLGRIADPDDICGIVVFLASRHAGYITGAAINITGGFQLF